MRWLIWCCLLMACDREPVAYVRLNEARTLASALEAELARSAEAANRAVMQDATAPQAVAELRGSLERDFRKLDGVVRGLGYELELLNRLAGELDKDRALEADLLTLTGEGSNVEAQKLSFGEAHAAVDRFHSVAPVAAAYALRSIEALEGPHIAEADDARMSALEREMDALLADARRGLSPAAESALNDFLRVHQRILVLSRRNTNVHALALATGDKRAAHEACARTLHELNERLQARTFPATR